MTDFIKSITNGLVSVVGNIGFASFVGVCGTYQLTQSIVKKAYKFTIGAVGFIVYYPLGYLLDKIGNLTLSFNELIGLIFLILLSIAFAVVYTFYKFLPKATG